MTKSFGFIVFAGLVALGCASSSSSGGASATCGVTDNSKITFSKVTKDASSGAACPALTPENLNGGGAAEGDAGADPCSPKFDKAACTATVSCTQDGQNIAASFTISSTALTGTITITNSGLTCKYAVEATVR